MKANCIQKRIPKVEKMIQISSSTDERIIKVAYYITVTLF